MLSNNNIPCLCTHVFCDNLLEVSNYLSSLFPLQVPYYISQAMNNDSEILHLFLPTSYYQQNWIPCHLVPPCLLSCQMLMKADQVVHDLLNNCDDVHLNHQHLNHCSKCSISIRQPIKITLGSAVTPDLLVKQ